MSIILMQRRRYQVPRLNKPTLKVIPSRRFKCLVIGKPLRTLMQWLIHDYLALRVTISLKPLGGRGYVSPSDWQWLRDHGFLMYNEVQKRLARRCYATNTPVVRALSRVILPYRRRAIYYDQEVLELDKLILANGQDWVYGPYPKQYINLPPIQIPIYNIHLSHGQRNQTPQTEPDEE